MDLRDYFAGKALQGLLANPMLHEVLKDDISVEEASYEFADEMIRIRNATMPKQVKRFMMRTSEVVAVDNG